MQGSPACLLQAMQAHDAVQPEFWHGATEHTWQEQVCCVARSDVLLQTCIKGLIRPRKQAALGVYEQVRQHCLTAFCIQQGIYPRCHLRRSRPEQAALQHNMRGGGGCASSYALGHGLRMQAANCMRLRYSAQLQAEGHTCCSPRAVKGDELL